MKTALWIPVMVLLTACRTTEPQLPRTSLSVADNINMDTYYGGYGNIISANSTLIANNLTKIIGAACIPDEKERCSPESRSVRQCLAKKTNVVIIPNFNNTPRQDFLISKNTKLDGKLLNNGFNLENDEYLNIKFDVIAIASVEGSGLNGFPGREEILNCLKVQFAIPETLRKVYWVNGASIISKTTEAYKKVSGTGEVTLTGMGIAGSTYNKTGISQTELFLGLDLKEVTYTEAEIRAFRTSGGMKASTLNDRQVEFSELKTPRGMIFNTPPELLFENSSH